MQTGKQVHKKIVDSVDSCMAEISKIDSKLNTTELEIKRQNTIRSKAIERLAEIYAANPQELSKHLPFGAASARVHRIFEDSKNRITALCVEIDNTTKELKQSTDAFALCSRDLHMAQDALIHARALAKTTLAANSTYTGILSEIEALYKIIEKDERRLRDLTQHCVDSLKPYDEDIYFQYLHNRGYGTPEYTPGLFPRVDRWLARLTRYDENVLKYNVLLVIPERLTKANQQRRALISEKTATKEKIEKDIEQQFSVKSHEKKVVELEANKERAQQRVSNINAFKTKLSKEKLQIESGQTPKKEAQEVLKTFFADFPVAALAKIAILTPTKEDEVLVKLLGDADTSIEIQRSNAKLLLEERSQTDKKLKKLQKLERLFTDSNYDSSRTRFDDGLNVDTFLTGYLAGTATSMSLERWRDTSSSSSSDSYRSGGSDSSYSSSSSDSYSSSSSDSYSSGGSDSGSSDGGSSSGGSD